VYSSSYTHSKYYMCTILLSLIVRNTVVSFTRGVCKSKHSQIVIINTSHILCLYSLSVFKNSLSLFPNVSLYIWRFISGLNFAYFCPDIIYACPSVINQLSLAHKYSNTYNFNAYRCSSFYERRKVTYLFFTCITTP